MCVFYFNHNWPCENLVWMSDCRSAGVRENREITSGWPQRISVASERVGGDRLVDAYTSCLSRALQHRSCHLSPLH